MYFRDLPKPPQVFDRAREWNELAAFVADENPGPRLGVVSGHRRQGKSFLLKALTEATGGFYFPAVEATRTESLRLLGETIGHFTHASVAPRPHDWTEALELLFDLAAQHPVPVVIDEFPCVVRGDSSLPSRLYAALGVRADRHPRLLLCGSAAEPNSTWSSAPWATRRRQSSGLSTTQGSPSSPTPWSAEPRFTGGSSWPTTYRRDWTTSTTGCAVRSSVRHADPDTFGGLPIEVTSGTVADPAARTSHEVDVVVRGAVGQDQGILLSIGEAKWNKVMDVHHLDRLRHILQLLTARGEVRLVDLRRLYGGA